MGRSKFKGLPSKTGFNELTVDKPYGDEICLNKRIKISDIDKT